MNGKQARPDFNSQRPVVRGYLLVCEHGPADVLQVANQGLQVGEGAGRGVGPRVEVACGNKNAAKLSDLGKVGAVLVVLVVVGELDQLFLELWYTPSIPLKISFGVGSVAPSS